MKGMGQKLIIISFILAVMAAASVFLYLKSLNTPKHIEKEITVIVAAENIPPRTLITSKMLKEIKVYENPVFESYINNSDDIVGKYSRDSIIMNDGFHKENLTASGSDELAFNIDKRHRAVSINVSGDSGVANLLKPGDWTDILVFVAEKKDGSRIVRPDEVRLILQNVEVLAVDKQLSRDEKAKTPDVIPTSFFVTLSIPVEDTEKLVLAESIGSIKLTLRPIVNDGKISSGTEVWQDSVSEEITKPVTGENAKVKKKIMKTVKAGQQGSADEYIMYTIKSGDTLKKISSYFYGDEMKYPAIKEANNIIDENMIITGEIIKIPVKN